MKIFQQWKKAYIAITRHPPLFPLSLVFEYPLALEGETFIP
jgi:hypothetical protein